MLLVVNGLVFSNKGLASTNSDTLNGIMDINIFRSLTDRYSWLSYDVDYTWKMGSPSSKTETRHYQMHNGQYLAEGGTKKRIQSYSNHFTVDTATKGISIMKRKNFMSIILFFDFDDSENWQHNIQRTYVVDSGSLRKLVVEFKPSSQMERYTAVYDPADFLPKQIRYFRKHVNSAGQREDYEFICNFKNYQTTAFDESVFSNDPYFSRVDGVPVLKEAYSTYKLFIYP